VDKDHLWHMETIARLSATDAGLLTVTRFEKWICPILTARRRPLPGGRK